VILPASEAEGLVEIVVLARPWLYMRVDINLDEIRVLVVGNGDGTTMECLLA
jgi:hypothetical protein